MSVLPPDKSSPAGRPDKHPEEEGPIPKRGKKQKEFSLPERDRRKLPEEEEEKPFGLFGPGRKKEASAFAAQAGTPSPGEIPYTPSGAFPTQQGSNRSEKKKTSPVQHKARPHPKGAAQEEKKKKEPLVQQPKLDANLQQLIKDAMIEFAKSPEGVKGAAGMTTDLSSIHELIGKMVQQMYTGTVRGEKITAVELKDIPDIPRVFAGATITVTETAAGVAINFSNFATPSMEGQAFALMEKNASQLEVLVNVLNSKNIQVASLGVGDRMVPLPPQTLGSPTVNVGQERFFEREGGGGGREGREREEEEEGPEPIE